LPGASGVRSRVVKDWKELLRKERETTTGVPHPQLAQAGSLADSGDQRQRLVQPEQFDTSNAAAIRWPTAVRAHGRDAVPKVRRVAATVTLAGLRRPLACLRRARRWSPISTRGCSLSGGDGSLRIQPLESPWAVRPVRLYQPPQQGHHPIEHLSARRTSPSSANIWPLDTRSVDALVGLRGVQTVNSKPQWTSTSSRTSPAIACWPKAACHLGGATAILSFVMSTVGQPALSADRPVANKAIYETGVPAGREAGRRSGTPAPGTDRREADHHDQDQASYIVGAGRDVPLRA